MLRESNPHINFGKLAPLLSGSDILPAQPNTFLGLNASCQGKSAVHLGVEPSVLTDPAPRLICPVLLALPHIFTA